MSNEKGYGNIMSNQPTGPNPTIGTSLARRLVHRWRSRASQPVIDDRKALLERIAATDIEIISPNGPLMQATMEHLYYIGKYSGGNVSEMWMNGPIQIKITPRDYW